MKKSLFTLFAFLLIAPFGFVSAQTQVGSTVYGNYTGGEFGYTTSLSGDGLRMIVGAPGWSNHAGQVKVFEFIGGNWTQIGSNIQSSTPNDGYGVQVDISANGNIIAILTSDEILMFEWQANNWLAIGIPIDIGSGSFDHSSLDLSDDGNTVIFGSEWANSYNGKAEVFRRQGNNWIQLGSTFFGGSNHRLGKAVSINSDGNIIAIGSPDAISGGNHGQVKVYIWNGTAWLQTGNTIYAPASGTNRFGAMLDLNGNGDRIGVTSEAKAFIFERNGANWDPIGSTVQFTWVNVDKPIALSEVGKTFVVGEAASGSNFQGRVMMFKIDATGNQTQIGSDVLGNGAQDWFGHDVSISSDGEYYAIGASENNPGYMGTGYVEVYQRPEVCTWEENVSAVYGSNTNDQFGHDVAYSSDGNFMVVGSPYNDVNGTNTGKAEVFEKVGQQWVQRGNDLFGTSTDGRLGYAVDISDDGQYVVAGAYRASGGGQRRGQVKVYFWTGMTYVQIANINGASNNDYFGFSVALSNSGKFLCVGSIYADNSAYNAGKVNTYVIDGVSVTTAFPAIFGSQANDQFGRAISLSDEGDFIAVGAPYHDSNGSNSGQVTVFKQGANGWSQAFNLIDGEAAHDYSGIAVDLNGKGNLLAIGATGNDGGGSNAGHVRVYALLSNGNVTQIGQDIDGAAYNDQAGVAVDLTRSGLRIAVGSHNHNGSGSASGMVQVYDYDKSSNSWIQEQNSIFGENAYDAAGRSVAISGDGLSVIVGSPQNDNAFNNAGQVRTFSTCSSNTKRLNSESFEYTLDDEFNAYKKIMVSVGLFPNPTSGILEISGITPSRMLVQLYDNAGSLAFSQYISENKFDISELTPGLYHVLIITPEEQHQVRIIKK